MEDLVRFRSRIDSLTDAEYRLFISSLDRQFLCGIFFKFFKNQLFSAQHRTEWKGRHDILALNKQIHKIITARDLEKQQMRTEHNGLSINTLPLEMISNVSSFLSLKCSIRFSLTNRHIFSGSRTLTPARNMSADEFVKCIQYSNRHRCMYNWFPLRRLSKVTIDIRGILTECERRRRETHGLLFNVSRVAELLQTRKVTSLSLAVSIIDRKRDRLTTGHQVVEMVNALANDSITELSIEPANMYKDLVLNDVNTSRLFPNLQLLSIPEWAVAANMIAPNLTGLDLSWGTLPIAINNDMDMANLRSFHTDCRSLPDIQLAVHHAQNITAPPMPNLQEVCITGYFAHGVLQSVEKHILQCCESAKLKRICLRFAPESSPSRTLSVRLREFIESMLDKTIGSLEFIAFGGVDRNHFEHLLCILSNYFAHCRRKESIKILISAHRMKYNADRIPLKQTKTNMNVNKATRKVIENLSMTLNQKTSHFVLTLRGVVDDACRLDAANDEYVVDYGTNNSVSISNQGCKLDGYQEKWLMNCQRCTFDPEINEIDIERHFF